MRASILQGIVIVLLLIVIAVEVEMITKVQRRILKEKVLGVMLKIK
jgi:hypothetical protein